MGDEPASMMRESFEQQLFAQALRYDHRQARSAFLDQACGDNAALRERLEALLHASDQAGDFLESPPTALDPNSDLTLNLIVPSEKPGDWIGRYKLLEEIGEGGCGIVYMAEQ